MELREIKIANVKDILDGEMKNFPVDDENEILLAKTNGSYYALAPHCTHYGAPLAEGVLSGDTIVCPWHHACFNVRTGDIKEPPALNALPAYDVRVEGEDIFVKVPQQMEAHRIPKMVRPDAADKRKFVIIGGGAAGYSAAQAMREAGYKGEIIVITPEKRTPYDRPNLSKDYLQGNAQDEWMPLRDDNFYSEYGIAFKFEKCVMDVDHKKNEVLLDGGEIIKYDKLLIASGGKPRTTDIEGSALKNIFTLRSFASCDEIIEASKEAKSIAIIGGSFIGMETAYSLRERTKLPVAVIFPGETPFEKVLGKEAGNLFRKKHEEIGIKFHLNTKAEKFIGNDKVESIILKNGEEVDAGLVLIGIGVKPSTDFLKSFDLEKDGGIKVNEYLQVNEDIYAAGDIAHFPEPRTNETMRIEHWRTALQQGRTAGLNIAGKEIKYDSVPFFWTKQSASLSYVGHASDWDEIITWGSIDDEDALLFYIKRNKVYAAAGIGRAKELAAVQHLMRNKKMPLPDELRDEKLNLVELSKD